MSASILFFLISRRRHPCILLSARPLSLFDWLTWSRLRIGENEWASAVTATGKVLIGAPATESAGMGTRPVYQCINSNGVAKRATASESASRSQGPNYGDSVHVERVVNTTGYRYLQLVGGGFVPLTMDGKACFELHNA